MRRVVLASSVFSVIALLVFAVRAQDKPAAAPEPEWAMNATIIEACSCPMFCQCYFDTKPAAHGAAAGHAGHEGHAMGGEMFCKMNNAFRVNSGNYGETKLDGAKFWVAGDLGGDF